MLNAAQNSLRLSGISLILVQFPTFSHHQAFLVLASLLVSFGRLGFTQPLSQSNMSMSSWPRLIRERSWPPEGIKYVLKDRYIQLTKLDLWLEEAFEAFGHRTKRIVRMKQDTSAFRICPLTCVSEQSDKTDVYVSAPRKPTDVCYADFP